MYNFELAEGENLIKIFDDIFIKQNENKKNTTIVLTDKRLLFLDYLVLNEGLEVLKIAKGMDYSKYKDVYYQMNLSDIVNISKNDFYKVLTKDNMFFEFDNEELYELLVKVIE